MTAHSDIPYLEHILEAIGNIEKSTESISKGEFIEEKDIQDANIMKIRRKRPTSH